MLKSCIPSKDKFTEWGKKGIAVGIQKYPEKLRGWAKLGAKALAEKYHDKFSEWGRKGAEILNTKYKDKAIEGRKKGHLNGALRGAENQKPTEQMMRLIEQNKQLGIAEGIDFKVNYTIRNEDNFRNFDFVYFKNGEPKLVEEDTTALPGRHRILEKAYQVVSSKRWLSLIGHNVKYLFLFPPSGRDSRGYPIRAPPEVVLGLVEEGITPCFYDEEWLKFRKEVIQSIFQGNYPTETTCRRLEDLYVWAFKEIRKRRLGTLRCARSESNSEMDPFEAAVHENLCNLGFEPEGKTIIESAVLNEKLGLRNSTYMVVDNSFLRDGERWYVQVSATNTIDSFRCSANRHAGYFWLLKKWFDPQASCLSIVFLVNDLFSLRECDAIVARRMFTDRAIYTRLDGLADSLQTIFCKLVEHTSKRTINTSAALNKVL